MMGSALSVRMVAALLIILLIAAIAIELIFQPRVRLTISSHLVGPDEPAVELIWRDAPLNEIQDAVKASGKNVNEIVWQGESLLGYAAEKKRPDIAKWLLEQGADPNAYPSTSPLNMAIHDENIMMIKLLLDYGADPDLDMGQEITPRWVAINVVKNQEIMKLLV